MSNPQHGGSAALVDHIPVICFEPQVPRPKRELVIFLHHLSGTKESTVPYLQDLAVRGFVALSFDAWQHGERGTESQKQILARVFGNFRRHMWPILGNTTLDTLRIIDWAISTLQVEPDVSMGGLSMGGDVAVAAAGIDQRIRRVVGVVATPDWLRPGMEGLSQPANRIPMCRPTAHSGSRRHCGKLIRRQPIRSRSV